MQRPRFHPSSSLSDIPFFRSLPMLLSNQLTAWTTKKRPPNATLRCHPATFSLPHLQHTYCTPPAHLQHTYCKPRQLGYLWTAPGGPSLARPLSLYYNQVKSIWSLSKSAQLVRICGRLDRSPDFESTSLGRAQLRYVDTVLLSFPIERLYFLW